MPFKPGVSGNPDGKKNRGPKLSQLWTPELQAEMEAECGADEIKALQDFDDAQDAQDIARPESVPADAVLIPEVVDSSGITTLGFCAHLTRLRKTTFVLIGTRPDVKIAMTTLLAREIECRFLRPICKLMRTRRGTTKFA